VLQLVLVASGVALLWYFVRQIRANRATPPLIAAELVAGAGIWAAVILVSHIGE
jgi:hypothetical protein